MTQIKTQKYMRKPLFVDAVQITDDNFEMLALWCQGNIESDGSNRFIRVRVHSPKTPRQSMGFVGDWILYTEMGYKVFTNRAFNGAFDPAE